LEGVPNETRKSFEDGTTIFERVLPGADRMYPDTDSKPIPLEDEYIENLSKNLPQEVIERYHQLKKWDVPEDTYTFIFKRNHYPMIVRIIKDLKQDPKFVGTFFGHTLKYVKGHYVPASKFSYEKIYELFKFVKDEKLDVQILKQMLPVVYEHPQMDFESVLVSINFKRIDKKEIVSYVPFLKEKFKTVCRKNNNETEASWVMGELRKKAIGNISMTELYKVITGK
jgi:glutamyl-tRNA(Gln) amidotransferase subunit E